MKHCNNLFYDPTYLTLLVDYSGNFLSEMDALDYVCAYPLNNYLATLAVKADKIDEFLQNISTINYVDKIDPFTLIETTNNLSMIENITTITPIEAAQIRKVQNNPAINVTGKDVIIGVIDTGIDYLNNAFLSPDGTTRIESIWDQSIQSENPSEGVPFGIIYTKEQINQAINLKNNGGDPYTVVPSRDEIGHGTQMSGIMAASGNRGNFKGIAPECEITVIKLKRYAFYEVFFKESANTNAPLFAACDIAFGLRYLYEVFLKSNKPMIIFIGVGSNFGSHTGLSLLGTYIDTLSISDDFIVVCGTGNEGDSNTHTTGFMQGVGSANRSIIELKVANLKNLIFQIWITAPNKALLGIDSPSGESLDIINPTASNVVIFNFSYENTKAVIRYYYPYDLGGGELIQVELYNIQEGIWAFYLTGEYISTGRYDGWLPQRDIIGEGTEFGSISQFTTLTIPSTSHSVIAVAYYNQTNDTSVADSGRGFDVERYISPLIAAGGINQPTVNAGGGITFVNGSCVATAVVAGGCALILEWARKGYKTSLNVQSLKGILAQTAIRQKGNIYPLPTYGYGRFDLENTFKAVR